MQGPPISGPKDRWRGRGGIVAGARDLDEGKRRSDEDYDALLQKHMSQRGGDSEEEPLYGRFSAASAELGSGMAGPSRTASSGPSSYYYDDHGPERTGSSGASARPKYDRDDQLAYGRGDRPLKRSRSRPGDYDEYPPYDHDPGIPARGVPSRKRPLSQDWEEDEYRSLPRKRPYTSRDPPRGPVPRRRAVSPADIDYERYDPSYDREEEYDDMDHEDNSKLPRRGPRLAGVVRPPKRHGLPVEGRGQSRDYDMELPEKRAPPQERPSRLADDKTDADKPLIRSIPRARAHEGEQAEPLTRRERHSKAEEAEGGGRRYIRREEAVADEDKFDDDISGAVRKEKVLPVAPGPAASQRRKEGGGDLEEDEEVMVMVDDDFEESGAGAHDEMGRQVPQSKRPSPPVAPSNSVSGLVQPSAAPSFNRGRLKDDDEGLPETSGKAAASRLPPPASRFPARGDSDSRSTRPRASRFEQDDYGPASAPAGAEEDDEERVYRRRGAQRSTSGSLVSRRRADDRDMERDTERSFNKEGPRQSKSDRDRDRDRDYDKYSELQSSRGGGRSSYAADEYGQSSKFSTERGERREKMVAAAAPPPPPHIARPAVAIEEDMEVDDTPATKANIILAADPALRTSKIGFNLRAAPPAKAPVPPSSEGVKKVFEDSSKGAGGEAETGKRKLIPLDDEPFALPLSKPRSAPAPAPISDNSSDRVKKDSKARSMLSSVRDEYGGADEDEDRTGSSRARGAGRGASGPLPSSTVKEKDDQVHQIKKGIIERKGRAFQQQRAMMDEEEGRAAPTVSSAAPPSAAGSAKPLGGRWARAGSESPETDLPRERGADGFGFAARKGPPAPSPPAVPGAESSLYVGKMYADREDSGASPAPIVRRKASDTMSSTAAPALSSKFSQGPSLSTGPSSVPSFGRGRGGGSTTAPSQKSSGAAPLPDRYDPAATSKPSRTTSRASESARPGGMEVAAGGGARRKAAADASQSPLRRYGSPPRGRGARGVRRSNSRSYSRSRSRSYSRSRSSRSASYSPPRRGRPRRKFSRSPRRGRSRSYSSSSRSSRRSYSPRHRRRGSLSRSPRYAGPPPPPGFRKGGAGMDLKAQDGGKSPSPPRPSNRAQASREERLAAKKKRADLQNQTRNAIAQVQVQGKGPAGPGFSTQPPTGTAQSSVTGSSAGGIPGSKPATDGAAGGEQGEKAATSQPSSVLGVSTLGSKADTSKDAGAQQQKQFGNFTSMLQAIRGGNESGAAVGRTASQSAPSWNLAVARQQSSTPSNLDYIINQAKEYAAAAAAAAEATERKLPATAEERAEAEATAAASVAALSSSVSGIGMDGSSSKAVGEDKSKQEGASAGTSPQPQAGDKALQPTTESTGEAGSGEVTTKKSEAEHSTSTTTSTEPKAVTPASTAASSSAAATTATPTTYHVAVHSQMYPSTNPYSAYSYYPSQYSAPGAAYSYPYGYPANYAAYYGAYGYGGYDYSAYGGYGYGGYDYSGQAAAAAGATPVPATATAASTSATAESEQPPGVETSEPLPPGMESDSSRNASAQQQAVESYPAADVSSPTPSSVVPEAAPQSEWSPPENVPVAEGVMQDSAPEGSEQQPVESVMAEALPGSE
mmetsp:Transcript_21339/g.35246  ORF Transcript_21339/g.35246 Transcript_21339/m.35246 type:complete len:1610 (+) Transcript_21339:672-5501(+)